MTSSLGLWGQGNLVITLKDIQETHSPMTVHCIYKLVNFQYRVRIFTACSVKISKINADSSIPYLLLYYHFIS